MGYDALVPHEFMIDAEVVVNEPIAHPCHGSPLDVGVLRAKVRRNLLRRFADNLEAQGRRRAEVWDRADTVRASRPRWPSQDSRLQRGYAGGTHAARRTSSASAMMYGFRNGESDSGVASSTDRFSTRSRRSRRGVRATGSGVRDEERIGERRICIRRLGGAL